VLMIQLMRFSLEVLGLFISWVVEPGCHGLDPSSAGVEGGALDFR